LFHLLAGLTDYEVRDLNDEINKIMREKRHWENQIVALGGANYRRNVAMLDDDGKEVPGTKGYKCVYIQCIHKIFRFDLLSGILGGPRTCLVFVNCFKVVKRKRKKRIRFLRTIKGS
jgi:hypothetical protein